MYDTTGETRTQKTRNLLDKSLRSEESVILLCGFLHELLVFVQPVCGVMKMDGWNSLDIHIL